MKMMIVVALALVAVASAVPVANIRQEGEGVEPVKTIRSESSQQPDGGYLFSFETANGISREENGELREVLDEENKPKNVVVVRGSFSYTDENGKLETINYYADESGYHAEGESVPKVAPSRR